MKERDSLRGKIVDYKNFTQILLALSTFLYFGLVIRGHDLPPGKTSLIFAATFVFLLLAFLFQMAARKYENQLIELEDQE